MMMRSIIAIVFTLIAAPFFFSERATAYWLFGPSDVAECIKDYAGPKRDKKLAMLLMSFCRIYFSGSRPDSECLLKNSESFETYETAMAYYYSTCTRK